MDYNWLTSGCDHDPMTIDANLAEIDFDDFKNEDIQNAYAFSLQSYVSLFSFNLRFPQTSTHKLKTRIQLNYKIINRAISDKYFSVLLFFFTSYSYVMSKEMLSSPKFEHVQRNAVDIKYTPWLIEEMGKKFDILRGAMPLLRSYLQPSHDSWIQ